MVTDRLERMVRQVRNWRSPGSGDDLVPDPSLDDSRALRRSIDDCLSIRGGEVAARKRAKQIGASFLALDRVGRRRFFELLVEDYSHDDLAIDLAAAELAAAATPKERTVAIRNLRGATQPQYEALLERFISFDGGLPFLIDLREELMEHRRSSPALESLDHDLRRMLERWFDVGLLQLERLTWDTPAALLEKLIDYEAVHAIESWADLRGRLGPGRRCYAFLHPGMPGDPLIFVEVALERGIPGSVRDILDHEAERFVATEADTAIFYSISNCHRGLAGVSLGDFLIKRVAEELSSELPNLKHFVTLSPLPGFRRWVEEQPDAPPIPDAPDEHADAARFLSLAAQYLSKEQRKGRALDPVAHFHLSNGARIERLHWWANPTDTGWDRGLGMMVNYYYELRSIEENRDRYVQGGRIAISDAIRKLAEHG